MNQPPDPASGPSSGAAAPRRVTLYHAAGCHLCERAIEVVAEVRERHPFDLELVDIGGDATLEAAYREHLPVIEIDGVRAFTYFVLADVLADRLAHDGSPNVPAEEAGNM